MRTALYVLLALAAPAFAGQTVWKWVDDKGVTHFSDQPVPGAEKMELNSSSRSASPAPSYSAPSAPPEAPKKAQGYARFVIESPQQDEAIINTGGALQVRLAMTPALGDDHSITLYLDGKRVEDFASQSTSHTFSEMPRGTHSVKAVVTTSRGVTVQETPPVTFHVRQESRAQPPVGPAMRNPNKPRAATGNKMQKSQPSYAALNGGKPGIDPTTNLPITTKPKPMPVGPKTGK